MVKQIQGEQMKNKIDRYQQALDNIKEIDENKIVDDVELWNITMAKLYLERLIDNLKENK